MYRKEVEQNQIRLEKLRADGAEEWDVKNAVRILSFSSSFSFLLPFDHACRLGISMRVYV